MITMGNSVTKARTQGFPRVSVETPVFVVDTDDPTEAWQILEGTT
jgi:hypothetical protein